jgi:microsomal dipeptidase-like Zn-dependent dipeptidase
MLKESVWYEKEPIIDTTIPVANYSQASMIQLAKSNVKIVFASLYPIEQGFFNLNGSTSEEDELLIDLFLRFPPKRVASVKSHDHDYFDDLTNEYHWLKKDESKPEGDHSFIIAGGFEDVKNHFGLDNNFNIANHESPVVVILTIEGAHSLGCGQENTKHIDPDDLDNIDTQALLTKLKQNINIIKNWDGGNHCPLFITFCHHFWNQLCGHSISFAKMANKVMNQDNSANPEYNTPFTKLGMEVLHELVKRNENGKRILIDTKHMTVSARKWYYQFALENDLPVFTSHSASNEIDDLDISHEKCDSHYNADKKYQKSQTFNNWDINLTREEIILVVKTGGLIGLNFDQRILTGKVQLAFVKFRQFFSCLAGKRRLWAKPIVNNIIGIVQILATEFGPEDNRIWEHITIGSDFDGIINPLHKYNTVEEYASLLPVLCELLRAQRSLEILKNKTDEQIDEIIEGFMFKNVLRFLSKNY